MENKGFEEDLMDLENYIEEFSLFLPLAVAIISPNGIITNINKAFSKLTHYSETEIAGKHAEGLFKGKEVWAALESAVSEEKKVEKEETCLISKKGEEIPISIFLSRREDKEGNFIGYFLGIDDITERKAAEYEIKESEEKYRLLAETSYDGIITTDRKGIITYVNPSLERMFDIPSSASVGTHFSRYITKKSALKGAKLFLDLITGKTNFYSNIEFEALHKDGHTFPVEISASSLIKGGKSIGMVGIIRDITERKKIISELEVSNEFRENIFNSMAEGVTVVDLDGKIIKANKVAIEKSGYTEEEFKGIDGTNLIFEEDRPKAASLMSDAIKKGFISDIELNHLTKDGKKIPMSVNITLLKDKEGRPAGILSVATDISKDKQLIKELQDAKKFSEGILDTMADGMIIMNPQAEVIKINKAEEELMGYKQEELAGEVAFKIGKSESIEKSMMLLKEAVEKGKAGPVELTSLTKEGKELPLSTTMSTLKDEQGKVQAIFTVSRDITELKKVHEAITESEEKLRAIFDTAVDGILYVDKDGSIIALNDRLAKMFGCEKNDLVGKSFIDIAKLEEKDIKKFLEMMTEGQTVKNLEMKIERKDGTTIPLEVNSSLIKKEGKILGFSAIVRDITERKKSEEAMRESEEKLRFIFDAAVDGILYVDTNGNLIKFNKKLTEILGCKEEDLLGKSFVEVGMIDPKYIPSFLEMQAKGESLNRFELEVTRKDGKTIPVEIASSTINPVKKEGKITGFVAIIRDITERKKTEEAVIESEEKLRSIFEAANDAVIYIDTNGNLVTFNKKLEDMFGYKKDELLGKNFSELGILGSEDVPKFLNVFPDAVAKGKILKTFEINLKRKDGVLIPTEVNTNFIKKENKIVGFSAIVRDITERKKSQEAVIESEEKLRSIFEAAEDGIVYADTSGNIITINKKAEEMTGYRLNEITGKNFAELKIFDPEEISRILNTTSEVIATGKTIENFYLTLIRRDGVRMPTEINTSFIRKEGKPVGFAVMIRDITERKRAEEAIRESEEKLRSIFDAAVDGIAYIDLNGNILSVNKRMTDMFGYKAEEVIGKNFADIGAVDPKDLPDILKMTEDTAATGRQIKSLELAMISKDGRKFPTEITSSVVKKEGRLVGISAIIRDITERKRAEEAMRESEERLKAIFDSVDDAVVYLDEAGNLVAFNKKLEEMFGYKSEELKGKNFAELGMLDPNDMSRFMEQVQEITSTGKTTKDKHLEIELIRKDGSRVPVEINSNIIQKENRVVGFAAVIRDITQRKRMQEEERSRTDELERFTKLAVGRELKMIELKNRINELEDKLKEKELIKGV